MSEEGNSKDEPQTVARALRDAANYLRRADFDADGARRDAALLLMRVLNCERAFLITHSERNLTDDESQTLDQFIRRRAAHEPLQYIVGHQEFYGLDFEITNAVLIPRPETELLIDISLEVLRGIQTVTFCDVGAGSGCIAIALLHELAKRVVDARAVGLDISTDALRIAARNRARHEIAEERLRLIESDVFAALDSSHETFDLIVSNPPYVAARELAGLQPEVRDYEPLVALTPRNETTDDGLSVVRRLLSDAPKFLNDGGYLLFEIGYSQRERVERLIDKTVWRLLEVRDDLQGIPRTFVLQLKSGD